MKKRVLMTSVVTIILCLCLIAGSTYALFTSTTTVNMVVGSATVQVSASISGLKLYSMGEDFTEAGHFENGGTATISGNTLTLDKMSPGDKVVFTIHVTNNSNIVTKYRAYSTSSSTSTPSLAEALNVSFNSALSATGGWVTVAAGQGDTITVTVEFPSNNTNEHDNRYQAKNATYTFCVEAVQGNG